MIRIISMLDSENLKSTEVKTNCAGHVKEKSNRATV